MTPPTTAQIKNNIVAQIQASIGQTIPIFPKAFTRVLALALAGVFVLLWKYAGFLGLQIFISQASGAATTINGKTIVPLIEWGRLLGVGDPNPSTQARLSISVPVKVQTGSLPAGAPLFNATNGVTYRTVAAAFLNAPAVTVTIVAVADQDNGDGSGDVGNLQPGDVVSFTNPQLNVGTDCTVLAQVTTGADAENIEVYRKRVLANRQARPQGGAYADYREWALDVLGIINVYPYAGPPGQVYVYCEADFASSGSTDGFPTLAQKNAVLASINTDVGGLATRRPVNAAVTVFSITRTAFNVQILGILPDTPESRTAIIAAISEYLAAREPFIEGLSVLPRNDRITQAAVAGIIDTVCEAQGAIVTSVTITPGPAYDLGQGEKAKLGTVSFV